MNKIFSKAVIKSSNNSDDLKITLFPYGRGRNYMVRITRYGERYTEQVYDEFSDESKEKLRCDKYVLEMEVDEDYLCVSAGFDFGYWDDKLNKWFGKSLPIIPTVFYANSDVIQNKDSFIDLINNPIWKTEGRVIKPKENALEAYNYLKNDFLNWCEDNYDFILEHYSNKVSDFENKPQTWMVDYQRDGVGRNIEFDDYNSALKEFERIVRYGSYPQVRLWDKKRNVVVKKF